MDFVLIKAVNEIPGVVKNRIWSCLWWQDTGMTIWQFKNPTKIIFTFDVLKALLSFDLIGLLWFGWILLMKSVIRQNFIQTSRSFLPANSGLLRSGTKVQMSRCLRGRATPSFPRGLCSYLGNQGCKAGGKEGVSLPHSPPGARCWTNSFQRWHQIVTVHVS